MGALLEKDLTTPEYYPLTVNALQNACNQKSSREPVMQLDEDAVTQSLERLQYLGLASRVSGAGHRVEKFGHRLSESMNLGRRELALLAVLMLRGPQTLGELRGRTERMHDFSDMDEVQRVLESLAAREPALVAPVGRGRWVHLWHEPSESPEPLSAPAAPASSGLAQRVETLEREVAELREQLDALRRQFE